MSKELEVWNQIDEYYKITNYPRVGSGRHFDKEAQIIKNALISYQYEKAILDRIRNECGIDIFNGWNDILELVLILKDFGLTNPQNLIDTLKNIRFLEKINTINSKKTKALKDIISIYNKWLGYEYGEYEFFTNLNDIFDKYGMLVKEESKK